MGVRAGNPRELARRYDELARVTKPGGHVMYTLRADMAEGGSGFREVQAALKSGGRWALAEVSEPLRVPPKGEPDVFHQCWVYEVTG